MLNTSSNNNANKHAANYYLDNNVSQYIGGDFIKKESNVNSKNFIEINNIEELIHVDSGNQKETAKNYMLNLAKEVYLIFDQVNLYLK